MNKLLVTFTVGCLLVGQMYGGYPGPSISMESLEHQPIITIEGSVPKPLNTYPDPKADTINVRTEQQGLEIVWSFFTLIIPAILSGQKADGQIHQVALCIPKMFNTKGKFFVQKTPIMFVVKYIPTVLSNGDIDVKPGNLEYCSDQEIIDHCIRTIKISDYEFNKLFEQKKAEYKKKKTSHCILG
jgi:hypothetical protein